MPTDRTVCLLLTQNIEDMKKFRLISYSAVGHLHLSSHRPFSKNGKHSRNDFTSAIMNILILCYSFMGVLKNSEEMEQ
jgi:hypothetical protein